MMRIDTESVSCSHTYQSKKDRAEKYQIPARKYRDEEVRVFRVVIRSPVFQRAFPRLYREGKNGKYPVPFSITRVSPLTGPRYHTLGLLL